MLAFNLFLFLSTRDRTYFFYALFQLGMVLSAQPQPLDGERLLQALTHRGKHDMNSNLWA